MTIALIDNGSVEAAAHRNLRQVAADVSKRSGTEVHPVSWKHSDQIPPDVLRGRRASILEPWLRAQFAAGERDFVFVPFFISAQGAIGSRLRRDIEKLQKELGGFRFVFTTSLVAQGALIRIVASRIRETILRSRLTRPPVVVVDHGGPSASSAQIRNQLVRDLRHQLKDETGPLIGASMEGAEYEHCRPVFADVLSSHDFDRGDIVVAPLFLSPGRHAGPQGDLAQIATAAEDRLAAEPLKCHFADLVGTHPDVITALSESLTQALSIFYAAA